MGPGLVETPKQLAVELCRGIRSLAAALHRGLEAGDKALIEVWRSHGSGLTAARFADAWAQTRVYVAFVARYWGWEGEGPRAYRLDPQVRGLFEVALGNEAESQLREIEKQLKKPDLTALFAGFPDPVLHFHELILEIYEPRERQRCGVYYTPSALVRHVLGRVHRSLQSEMGLRLGLADTSSWAEFASRAQIELPEGVDAEGDFVRVLDPAAGTGAFLLGTIELVHTTMQADYAARALEPEAALDAWQGYVRSHLLPRLHGIELMLGAWVVSLIRLRMALEQTGFVFGDEDRLGMVHGDALGEDRTSSGATVIVGNPPFFREAADSGQRSLLRGDLLGAYRNRARELGAGAHLKNLHNLYVYFWRWASWELFERSPRPGILAFVSASSYLRGPGFVGMRASLRALADIVEIVDLGGEQRGTRASENVFAITTPVCVGTLIVTGRSEATTLRYLRVQGTREDKLQRCLAWGEGEAIPWQDMPTGPTLALVAGGRASYQSWPRVTELLPWQHSGAQFKRTWPIASSPDMLERRWQVLVEAPVEERPALLRETRDRKADRSYAGPRPNTAALAPISSLEASAETPTLARYAFRPWDRQWCLADARLGDFLRPALWAVESSEQVYMSSLLAGRIGPGPAAVASAHVPDLHHFRGSYGGKDVIALWRDADAQQPNSVVAQIRQFEDLWQRRLPPHALYCYVYAVLANPGYTSRFEPELELPGPRIPLTKDLKLFERGVELGAELLHVHCYGQRLQAGSGGSGWKGRARILTALSDLPGAYPESFAYDPDEASLRVGAGLVGPVPPALWAFSVSGLRVLESWLGYRMRAGAGRRSSALDELRPLRWTEQNSQELLELLWVLEWSLAHYPVLESWLEQVLDSSLFTESELEPAQPTERSWHRDG